jgi:hypothetical protein
LRFLERYGLDFLRRWNARERWEVRHLTPAEAEEIRRTERRAVLAASLAGVVSGAILGATEMALAQPGAGELALSLWRESWRDWGAFLGVIVLVSVGEMLFLYWNAVRATARASDVAGLRIAEEDRGHVVPVGLARAALELPDPREPVHGIDPFARTPRWKLTLWALLYRVKVGATSFLLRIFLRRLLGRTALRLFIPLLAIPVYALWNAVVTARVLRQVRIRAFGPAAVDDVLGRVLSDPERLSDDARRAIFSGIGEIIIRNADAHPNFVLLVGRLLEDLEMSSDVETGWVEGRTLLARLDDVERSAALALFDVATVIDGRLRRREMRFLAEAYRLCERPFDPDVARRMRDAFLDGGPIPLALG